MFSVRFNIKDENEMKIILAALKINPNLDKAILDLTVNHPEIKIDVFEWGLDFKINPSFSKSDNALIH